MEKVYNGPENVKITFEQRAMDDAQEMVFSGSGKLLRLWSLFKAECRCNWYLLWAAIGRGECMFVCYGDDGKRSIIGTSTGSLFDGTMVVKRVFWCEDRQQKGDKNEEHSGGIGVSGVGNGVCDGALQPGEVGKP